MTWSAQLDVRTTYDYLYPARVTTSICPAKKQRFLDHRQPNMLWIIVCHHRDNRILYLEETGVYTDTQSSDLYFMPVIFKDLDIATRKARDEHKRLRNHPDWTGSKFREAPLACYPALSRLHEEAKHLNSVASL